MSVGPTLIADGNTPSSGRQGKTSETIVSQAHGKYYEAASRGVLFAAGDAGVGVTVQVTVTTTALFTLHNPANSKTRLALKKLSLAYFSGTLGAGAFYHGGLPPGKTLPSSGTNLPPQCLDLGSQSSAAAAGIATSGATVVAGTILYPFASSFAALASSAFPLSPCIEDINGAIVLEPGAQYQLLGVFGGTGSTPKVSVGLIWEEVPVV